MRMNSDQLPTLEEMLREKLAFEAEAEVQRLLKRSQPPVRTSTTPRPDLNSKILENQGGGLALVIGGVAYMYPSDKAFRQVHFRCYWKREGQVRTWTCPRTHSMEQYPDISIVDMDPVPKLRKSPITGAVHLIRSGTQHGINHWRAFDNYQFDWDDVHAWEGTREEWGDLEVGVLLFEQRGGLYD